MKKVKLLEQFLHEDLNEGLFDVVTKSKAFIKNPISATKITNNGKKLAQAEIDNAANELDYEKRKLAAKKAMDSKIEAANKKGDKETAQKIKDQAADSREVLKKAQDQKAEALKDKVESIKDRIDDLATNKTLKELGSLVKTASRIKRNEVLLKGADDEEKKQLKIQMKDDMEKIDDLKKGFGEYEGAEDKEAEPKAEPSGTEKKPSSSSQKEPADTSKEPSQTEEPAQAEPTSTKPKDEPQFTTTAAAEEPKKPTGEKPKDEKEAAEKYTFAKSELDGAQGVVRKLKNAKKKYQEKIDDIEAGKYQKKDISDPEAEIAKYKKEIKTIDEQLPEAQTELKRVSKIADKAYADLLAFTEKSKPKESFTGLKSFKDFVHG